MELFHKLVAPLIHRCISFKRCNR